MVQYFFLQNDKICTWMKGKNKNIMTNENKSYKKVFFFLNFKLC